MSLTSQRTGLVAELRRIAAQEPRFTYESLYKKDRPLLQRLLTEFGGLAHARKAARLPPLDRARKWTDELVNEEFRKAYRETGALTVAALLKAGRSHLVSAIAARGGIIHARRRAQLPEPARVRRRRGHPWDADRVISEILDRHGRNESVAFSKVPSGLTAAGKQFFGSWREAIEAAGLNYDEVRLLRAPYTREEVIELLRRLAREQPRMLWGELYEHSALSAINRFFGSVPAAVRASGVIGWPLVGQGQWSREGVVQAIKVTQDDRPHALAPRIGQVAIWYAGGANNARREAGVEMLRRPWTRERVISELRESVKQGSAPSSNLKAACVRLYGGVPAARDAAGVELPEPVWSRERIIRELREHAARGEHVVRGLLAEACYRHFGGVRAARREAGVADPPRSWWTRERVITALQREHATGVRVSRSTHAAAAKLFGSTHAARQAARVRRPPARRDSWSKERLINELRQFAREERELTQRLRQEARRLFGTISAARTAAGVSQLIARHWTRQRVLDELKAHPEKASRNRTVRRAAERHFGTVQAALDAAGVTTRLGRWDKATVIEELREAARGDGRIRPALALAAGRQFGSITAARKAAGVPLLQRRGRTREDLIAELRQHGSEGMPAHLQHVCRRMFGSVDAAREAAGLPPGGVVRTGAPSALESPKPHARSNFEKCLTPLSTCDASRFPRIAMQADPIRVRMREPGAS